MYRIYPRREVDDQGRSVQFFPGQKGDAFSRVFFLIFGAFFILFAIGIFVEGLVSGDIEAGVFAGIGLCCGAFLSLMGVYLSYRLLSEWYYEDEYCFETFDPVMRKHKKVAYNDIVSYKIEPSRGGRRVAIRMPNGNRVYVKLAFYRPLMLLDALLRMEKEGRFSEKGSRKRCETLEKEFRSQVDAVREEMKKTGATIYIPEH